MPPFKITKNMTRQLERENMQFPEALVQIHKDKWPPTAVDARKAPDEYWRSRRFQVLVFKEENGIERLSIHRTAIDLDTGRFKDGIEWDDIQRLKSECGRGDQEAVEIYPRDLDLVNVANMRHIWVLKEGMPFTWRKK